MLCIIKNDKSSLSAIGTQANSQSLRVLGINCFGLDAASGELVALPVTQQ